MAIEIGRCPHHHPAYVPREPLRDHVLGYGSAIADAGIGSLRDHVHQVIGDGDIDFDAGYSQHSLYRALLARVRAGLPQGMPLSITALVSWCGRDSWLAGLPIDEAVPMFFRMGHDAHPSEPGWNYPLLEPKCMNSAGVSMDEAWPHINHSQRIYVFHPRAWNRIALHNLELLIKP